MFFSWQNGSKSCTTCDPGKLGHLLPIRLDPFVLLQNESCWMKVQFKQGAILITHVMRKNRRGKILTVQQALEEFDDFLEKNDYDFSAISMTASLQQIQSYCFKPSSGCVKFFVTCAMKNVKQSNGGNFPPSTPVRLRAFARSKEPYKLVNLYRSIGFRPARSKVTKSQLPKVQHKKI